jgi:hypothetical protein
MAPDINMSSASLEELRKIMRSSLWISDLKAENQTLKTPKRKSSATS